MAVDRKKLATEKIVNNEGITSTGRKNLHFCKKKEKKYEFKVFVYFFMKI